MISAHHSGVYKTFDLSSFTSEYLNYSNDSWHADQEHDAADGVYEILSTPGIELKPGTYTVAVTADADYDQNGYVYTRNFMVPDGDYTKLTTFVVCHDIDTTYFRFQLEERSKVQFRIGYSGFGDLDVKGVSVSKSAIGPFLIFSYALIFFAIADLLFYHFAFVKEDKNQRALKVASSISFAAVCVVAFVSILVFLADKYDIINNSDIASQIVLAKECFKEHSLIARDWFYATEIRVLALQAIYALLFVFTNNWHMIRLIGNGIQYAPHFPSFYSELVELCPVKSKLCSIYDLFVFYDRRSHLFCGFRKESSTVDSDNCSICSCSFCRHGRNAAAVYLLRAAFSCICTAAHFGQKGNII